MSRTPKSFTICWFEQFLTSLIYRANETSEKASVVSGSGFNLFDPGKPISFGNWTNSGTRTYSIDSTRKLATVSGELKVTIDSTGDATASDDEKIWLVKSGSEAATIVTWDRHLACHLANKSPSRHL